MSQSKSFRQKNVIQSVSSTVQESTEDECSPFFVSISEMSHSQRQDLTRIGLLSSPEDHRIQLLKEKHAFYLTQALLPSDEYKLSKSYLSLDSSRPWIIYWNLHSLDLMNCLPPIESLMGIVSTLRACWMDVKADCGGFGGGPGQLPHCAPTYAAVNALLIIAGLQDDKYSKVKNAAFELLLKKRILLKNWFQSLRYEYDKDDNGIHPNTSSSIAPCGFRMHHDGEVDVRASYCICSVADLLNILSPDLYRGMLEHILQCQTYEGGFGGEPFCEAHGGYTFCALGALHILTKAKGMTSLEESGVDVVALRDWLVRRQMAFEGGFQGRCNKLVDGCYSFWVGGAIAVFYLDASDAFMMSVDDSSSSSDCIDIASQCILDAAADDDGQLLFDQKLLQRYILLCAQDVNGGLRDKPSKARDFYHSCYNLSGLSISQHFPCSSDETVFMYENVNANILGVTHPVFNIRVDRVKEANRMFDTI